MSFTRDFHDANHDFSAFRDEILSHIGGGKLIDLEKAGQSDPVVTGETNIAAMFDQYSGVDALHLANRQLRLVALRVQWCRNWATFTIRYKRRSGAATEYMKRVEAIQSDKGWLYPHLTVQAYLDKRGDASEILGCGIVKTKDLYDHIHLNMPNLQIQRCNEGNQFLVVPFCDLQRARKDIIVFGSDYQMKQAA